MGLMWAVLMPMLIVAAGALVRVAMAFVGGRALVPEEVVGIAVKAVPWSFFVGALGFGINSLTGNASLVTKSTFRARCYRSPQRWPKWSTRPSAW